MQTPKKHLPVVGVLGIIVIAAAGGGIYYYQFVLPHNVITIQPLHRLIFMTAIVHEEGGFHIFDTGILNQTTNPPFSQTGSGANLTGLSYHKYQGASDNNTVLANVGDTITFYIKGLNATSPCGTYADQGKSECWQSTCGHGFEISGSFKLLNGTLGGVCGSPSDSYIPYNQWYTVSVMFTAKGTYAYFCFIPCSPEHTQMNGNIVVS